jgi:hypothetical protein
MAFLDIGLRAIVVVRPQFQVPAAGALRPSRPG